MENTTLVESIQMLYLRLKAEQLGHSKRLDVERPWSDRGAIEMDIVVDVASMSDEFSLPLERREVLCTIAKKAAGLLH